MTPCGCEAQHVPQRVVLTGGPGAGKTAVLELVRQTMCRHAEVLPEAAGILFAGGFRRGSTPAGRAAAQRAIFHVQRELEALAEAESQAALVLCDRGTIDGYAYWPGDTDFFAAFGTHREQELERYHAVIHLRTPAATNGYHRSAMRIESAAEAALIDARIAEAWSDHPRRFVVETTHDFLAKAYRVLEIVKSLMPACCRAQELAPNLRR